MQYMGSKNRIAKHILPVILADQSNKDFFVEPFCGGCNVTDKIIKLKRIANDNNSYLIAMWKALQAGWVPPTEISKEFYYKVKSNTKSYPDHLVCFIAMLCSFGGKWWGGYAFNKKGDNYALRASRVLIKQIRSLIDVDFRCSSYLDLIVPENSIVYCDPPYENTTNYKDKFDHKTFWDWVRALSRSGNAVFVSEYKAPKDFKCLLEIEHKTILDKNSNYVRTEKLFKLRDADK